MKISARFLLIFAVVAAATIVALTQGKIPGLRGESASQGQTRTSWGAPDLQGIWNTNTFVPLERPTLYGTRATMTEEEHAKALAELQERNKRPGRDSRAAAIAADSRSPAPAAPAVRKRPPAPPWRRGWASEAAQ